MRLVLILASFLLSACSAVMQTTASDAAERLGDLFEEDWEWTLREYPEWSTHLGDRRYNDRLTDFSSEAIGRRDAHAREMLSRVLQVDRTQLGGQDVISYDLFLLNKQLEVQSQQFPLELMPVTQMGGPQISIVQLAAVTAFDTVQDYEDYLRRLEALPVYLSQITTLMRRGIETGWVPAAIPLRSVPSQIEAQIVAEPARSPLYAPFQNFPSKIAATDRTRLQNRSAAVILEQVVPAWQKFAAFLKDEYLPACRQDIAAGSLPGGNAYYEYWIQAHTNTNFSPRQIHDTGMREVRRIRGEMEKLIQQVGFRGPFEEFLQVLRTDPQFYYTDPRDLMAGYAAIAKRMDGELPRLFAELPRMPYGIREIAPHEAPSQTAAYYLPGAADGSRAGYLYVNTSRLDTRPRYEMEALVLHESVPGHHVQIARARELEGLPNFRRNGSYPAFVEGWALYAETLGNEIDFYSDPYSRFGQLTYEMWRACRLVIDTGIHAFGWTRRQAIDFMLQNTAKTENEAVVEIDRYIVWPGQALAYKLGELKIREVRAKAETRLGNKFDIRSFHNAVVDNGPLPLNVLEQQIEEWVTEQRGRAGE